MAQTNKSLVQSLREHETTIVEVAAVLTASTRWVITFSPIDKTNLTGIIASMGGWWDGISAFLSVSFAVVEIWATAMIMRAFNIATDKKDKAFLGVVWLVSLVVLALVQIPPLYASLMNVPVASLEGWNAIYVIATSIAAFVVIAGVSYSDRFKAKTEEQPFKETAPVQELQKRVEEMAVETPVYLIPKEDDDTVYNLPPMTSTPVLITPVKAHVGHLFSEGYTTFSDKMRELNGDAPRTGYAVSKIFHVTPKTGKKWLDKYTKEHHVQEA